MASPGRIGAWLVLVAILAAWPSVSAAQRRVALLVGNNTYPATPLRNAVNDARDLGSALRALGFTTIVRENATRRDMVEALREFGQAAQGADAAVFFYAGHALQFKDRNYLVPIDSDIRSEDDIALFSVEIQLVFDRMDRARTRQNVIILDACRDNPFASTFKVASPGLAQSSAPSGTLIAYATAPGSVAADGHGRNGIYTRNLLKHIATPGLPVEQVFKRVRAGVEADTARQQTPWDVSSLKEEFHFHAGARATEAPAPANLVTTSAPSADVQLQIEREFWVSVRDSTRPEELQAYLDHYPNGKYVVLARLRLQKLLPSAPVDDRGRTSWRDAPARDGWPRLHAVSAQAAPAAAAPHTTAELFRGTQVTDMQLSPDGRNLAASMPVAGRQNLVVLEVATNKARAVSGLEKLDVAWFRWLSNRRLLLQTGTSLDRECDCRVGTLLAIDIDGGHPRRLAEGLDADALGAERLRTLRAMQAVHVFRQESDAFIAQEVTEFQGRFRNGAIYRVDSRTGRRLPFTSGKPDSGDDERWVFDDEGTARVFTARRGGRTTIHYRDDARAPWQKLDEFDSSAPSWEPLAIAADGRSIYARSWRGRDKAAIVSIEPRPGAAERVIASHPFVDVKDLVFDGGVAVGVGYNADRPGVAWFDEEVERIQAAVNEALPDTTNELSWARARDQVLVRSASDTAPGTFYLFDRRSGKLRWLADRMPWIKPAALQTMKPVRYRARDGLDIPAYLTLPRTAAGARPPLVVMVHDGPWNEGYSRTFNASAQDLAARGFAVLQPNYRGTVRYGWRHFSASFGQWGRAMQDDLVDGVRWAVAQGHVDGKRVCIAGQGYGGYAALMALARDATTFRCGASVEGFTDLERLVESPPHTMNAYASFTPARIAGEGSGRAALAQLSPKAHAARIAAPVLLAYDVASPQGEFAQAFRTEVESGGGKPTWLELRSFAGAPSHTNSARLQEAFADFLATHIGLVEPVRTTGIIR